MVVARRILTGSLRLARMPNSEDEYDVHATIRLSTAFSVCMRFSA